MKILISSNQNLIKIIDNLWLSHCYNASLDFYDWLLLKNIIITDHDDISWRNEYLEFNSEEDYFLFLMEYS